MSAISVQFTNVSKQFESTYAVKDISLQIPNGQIVTLIGPSGCGKTTSLKMINRLAEPSEGQIKVNGTDITTVDPVELRRSIGYVIQQIGLFPHLTIEQNISLVPRLKGLKKEQLVRRTEELLDLIGLDPAQFRHRFPLELSGGQQQRIGVARALAADPYLILMDEPFSALDPISRVQLQNELIKLNQTLRKTIVFVTHDITEALKIADQVVLLNHGSIVQKATPSTLVKEPANEFVRSFIGLREESPSQRELTAADLMRKTITVGIDVPHAGEAVPRDAPSVPASASAEQAAALLRIHPVLPVVDDEERIVGTITLESAVETIQTAIGKRGKDDEYR